MASKRGKIEHVFTGMEIDESLELHIKAWKLQPFAWTLIGLFVLAGLMGFFGTGPVSHAIQKQGGTTIDYERFYRTAMEMKLTITDDGGSPETVVKFPISYISSFTVVSVIPEPVETSVSEGEISYVFKTEGHSHRIVFYLEPQETGKVSGDLSVNENKLHLSQIIYP